MIERILIALLLALIFAIILTTTFFLIFGQGGIGMYQTNLISIFQNATYWLGIGIFWLLSTLFIFMPATLLFIKS